ncbi:MAG: hypothetical protein RL748_315 [Pseudomonadota bacterium]|jgi:hypothetical protein
MNTASQLFAKATNNVYADTVRASAEKVWETTQAKLNQAQLESTIRLSKLAQKNLLAMAKGAEKLSQTLVDLSDKLEPVANPVVAKPAKKVAAKKPAAAKAVKAAAPKAAAATASAPKAKAPAKAKAVKAVVAEVAAPEAVAA